MGLEVSRRPRARLDLIEIWTYVADDNEAAADRLLRRIDSVLDMLADTPLAGRARPELHPEIRSFPVGNYVVFYVVQPAAMDVVRVLSRYRDITGEDLDEGS
ncbi:type II toxin-antitoxin system RelE/ParE family toxin [Pleomorphomonas carboxyditropha]|uniref:Plasmid stabilization protein n=1 Tax=Pleomorphomonas carboxyditropha TaxID=2023338 RepID=A0A2G9WNB9_9HYPH|nr:type II toxin-antitoxin system RelE/ParE family toxin [Pleomorphomonas carboxyditropha]PIO96208.1 plasmid stabilization protein [Pleomorphomonas carboxyditropha]